MITVDVKSECTWCCHYLVLGSIGSIELLYLHCAFIVGLRVYMSGVCAVHNTLKITLLTSNLYTCILVRISRK